jgi:hypothetical protein
MKDAGGTRYKMSVTFPDSMPVLASFLKPSPSPDFYQQCDCLESDPRKRTLSRKRHLP